MSNRSVMWVFVGVLAGALAGCKSTPPAGDLGLGAAPAKGSTLVLLFQQGREGQVEPCGCHTTPYGGIDREKNAIEAVRKEFPGALFLDAGNLFVPTEAKVPLTLYKERAPVLTRMLGEMGLTVFGPGPSDYQLGADFLRGLQKQASFKFISTNVRDAAGKAVFAPFHIAESNGVRAAFFSVLDEKTSLGGGLKAISPKKALEEAIAQVGDKAQVFIVATQLGTHAEARKLAAAVPGVQIWVGNDPKLTLDRGELQDKALLLDGHRFGYFLGKLRADLKFPLNGFYSEAHLDANRKTLAGYEGALKKIREPKRREALETRMRQFKVAAVLEAPAGATQIQSELIALDAKRFGSSNSFTQEMKSLAEKAKRQALDAGGK